MKTTYNSLHRGIVRWLLEVMLLFQLSVVGHSLHHRDILPTTHHCHLETDGRCHSPEHECQLCHLFLHNTASASIGKGATIVCLPLLALLVYAPTSYRRAYIEHSQRLRAPPVVIEA